MFLELKLLYEKQHYLTTLLDFIMIKKRVYQKFTAKDY